jgi:hypothetical protein
MFTTCDAASSETDVFASCPLTESLAIQFGDAVGGANSAADPLGGGQDPEWTAERFTAEPSSTGGVVHATLGTGSTAEKLDLVMVIEGSELLVNDVYCTGSNPEGSDALAPGWLARSTCSA